MNREDSSKAAYIAQLEQEVLDWRRTVAILLNRLGGKTAITNQEIVEVARYPMIETLTDVEGVQVRVVS